MKQDSRIRGFKGSSDEKKQDAGPSHCGIRISDLGLKDLGIQEFRNWE